MDLKQKKTEKATGIKIGMPKPGGAIPRAGP